VGGEFRVNSYTYHCQDHASVAADGSGGFVVVWQDATQDGSYLGVFGQRFDSAGNPVGSEFQVNSYTTNYQLSPAAAADAAGNFVVVWDDSHLAPGTFCVSGQRFDSTGLPVGDEFQVNSYTTSYPLFPAVAADAAGNFVVVWGSRHQYGSSREVFGQRFDSMGLPVGGEFQVNSYTHFGQFRASVAAEGSGDFVVVWQNEVQDGFGFGVFGRRFDAAGPPIGSEFQVNSYTMFDQIRPAVATDGSGKIVVVWESEDQDSSEAGVFGQRLSSPPYFYDGFESGDFGAWSLVCNTGPCP
jgi:hypothetical protein